MIERITTNLTNHHEFSYLFDCEPSLRFDFEVKILHCEPAAWLQLVQGEAALPAAPAVLFTAQKAISAALGASDA
jgi:hypothetical protein